jgi:hypothetical protein
MVYFLAPGIEQVRCRNFCSRIMINIRVHSESIDRSDGTTSFQEYCCVILG